MGRKIIITAFWVVLFGLCKNLSAQQFSIRKYTAVDGLPQSEVRAMVEDKNGYLWIATQGGGLARFDGRKFEVYTTLDGLLNNIVNTLMIDSQNNIWMAHPRGITKFDGKNFKQFLQPADEVGSRRIRRIFERGDSVFFVVHPGLMGKIYNDSVHYWSKPIAENKIIFFTYVKPEKAIIHYLNDSSFLYYSHKGEKRNILSHKNIFRQAKNIFSMGDNIAIKSEDAYYRLDMEKNQLVKEDIKITRHIIFYDTLNEVFWTRSENRLFKEKMVNENISSELVYDGAEISQVLPDGEGNTWIGSMGDGLIRHFNQDFDRCASDKLRLVMAIAKDPEGRTWIGASSGLLRMTKGKLKSFTLPNAPNIWVSSIKVSQEGQVYVASKSGLGIHDKIKDDFKWMNRSDGLSSSYISSIEPIENGVYIGTVMGGLNFYDGKTFTLIKDNINLKTKNIATLKYIPKSKSLFIGTDFGLSVLSKNGETKNIWLPEFENASILSLSAYKDSLLLIGSGGAGIAVYNPLTKKSKFITPRDGLNSGFVFFVAPDEKDRIWIGTVSGISRIKLNDKLEIIESLHFGFDNGLTGIETNQNAFFLGEKEKYFGLIDGLYQYNDLISQNLKTLPTHLTGVEILFGQVDATQFSERLGGFFKIPQHLSVPYSHNHLTFHFNRVDKRNPKSVQYKYFLENFDKTWSHPTPITEVTYGSLPSGQYTFKVVATNKDGSWESEPLQYTFLIQTPFYQTAWFVSFVFLFLIASLLFAIMYRVRARVAKVMETERIRQREQESLRKEIARDFHDEMGNQLTRIINYVSLLKLTVGSNGSNGKGNGKETDNSEATKENGHGHLNGLSELFNKVEASAKKLYTGTRDFIWAIDPVNDELSQLFIHLRDFGVKLFEEKGIIFRANNNVRDSFKLPYGFSREANLIFKEAMTNAFKHSQAGNVTLNINKSGEEFVVELTDDGVGFSYSSIVMNGLRNIRGRAERINAKLNIEGGLNEGTKITLSFALHKTKKLNQYVKL